MESTTLSFLCSLCLLTGVQLCFGQVPPVIITSLKTDPASPKFGQNVKIICKAKVTGVSKPSISFQHKIRGVKAGKVVTTTDGVLHIDKMAVEHEGDYECTARITQPKAKARSKIKLYFNGSFVEITGLPDRVEGKAGSDVTVKCYTLGIPQPKISWWDRLGNPITANVKELPASNKTNGRVRVGSEVNLSLERTMLGNYLKCRGESSSGQQEKYTYLNVKFAPVWDDKQTRQVNASIGQVARLYCSYYGNAAPVLKWVIDKLPKELVTEKEQVDEENGLSVKVLEVTVKNSSQFQLYECQATSPLGSATAFVNLSGIASAKQKTTSEEDFGMIVAIITIPLVVFGLASCGSAYWNHEKKRKRVEAENAARNPPNPAPVSVSSSSSKSSSSKTSSKSSTESSNSKDKEPKPDAAKNASLGSSEKKAGASKYKMSW